MKWNTRQQLMDWTYEFADCDDGRWLEEFWWQDVPFDWYEKCNSENGIMGMYAFGRIWLMDLEISPELIWPTYIHELYHRWQWKTNPLKYILGKLYRPLIENPADKMTEFAEKWISAKLNNPNNKEDNQ